MNYIKYLLVITFFFVNLSAQVEVSIPDTSATQGSEILIPVYTSSIDGQDVVSYQFMVTFNEMIIDAVEIITDGSLTPSGWFAIANTNVDGQVSVAASGATSTSGEGVLVYLKFNVVGASGTTDLAFDNFTYNSGEPTVNLSDGSFSVEEEQIGVSLPELNASSGQEILIPVTTEDISDMNIVSYQFTISFDETIIDAVEIITEGSLTPSGWFAVGNTNVDGEISVAASGATPTSGEGVLVYLKFNVVGENGSTALAFDDFIYNAGSPSALLTNGSLTIIPDIGWCNLQWPPSINIIQGESADIYSQVWIDAVTQETGATEELEAWIGFSTSNSDPSTWTEESWQSANFNVDSGNNDEFMIGVPNDLEIGTYFYASRFRYAEQNYYYGGYSSSGGGFWEAAVNYSGTLIIRDTVIAPSNLALETTSSQASLSWIDNSENESGFYVEKKILPSGEFIPIDTLSDNATNFIDFDVYQGSTYNYRVKAFNANTESDYSNTVEGIIPIEEILPPSDLTATEEENGVSLNWNDNSENETYFVIERSQTDESNFLPIDTLTENSVNYLDEGLEPNYRYYYRIYAFNEFTNSDYSNTSYADYLVGIENGESLPSNYKLFQNYPNPFNPTTVLKFGLPENTNVKLIIFNSLGEQISTLVNKNLTAGYYEVSFSANSLPSGIYYYQLITSSFSDIKKMILLK